MNKTGIVINVMNKKAGIMTSCGEFVYIKTNKILPEIGEIHTGQICNKNLSLYKYAIAAASFMFIFISSTFAHAYYTPITNIVVNINPSVSIKANRWNKIIGSKALNLDGSSILQNIKLNYKSIDVGLELLVKEARTEKFINDKYIKDKKIISIHIKSNKDRTIDISNFKKIIDSNNLNIQISTSSENNKILNVTANNKKIDTTNINSINNKKDTLNKTPHEKPSADNNTKINKDKSSSENKKEFKKNPTKDKDSKTSENTNSTINTNTNINTKINNATDNNNNNNNNESTIKKPNTSNELKNNIPFRKK